MKRQRRERQHGAATELNAGPRACNTSAHDLGTCLKTTKPSFLSRLHQPRPWRLPPGAVRQNGYCTSLNKLSGGDMRNRSRHNPVLLTRHRLLLDRARSCCVGGILQRSGESGLLERPTGEVNQQTNPIRIKKASTSDNMAAATLKREQQRSKKNTLTCPPQGNGKAEVPPEAQRPLALRYSKRG